MEMIRTNHTKLTIEIGLGDSDFILSLLRAEHYRRADRVKHADAHGSLHYNDPAVEACGNVIKALEYARVPYVADHGGK